MSEAKKQPLTLKSVLTLAGAGLLYLGSQAMGCNIPGLETDGGGSAAGPDSGGTKVVVPNLPGSEPKAPSKGAPKADPKKDAPVASAPKAPTKKEPAAAPKKQRDDTALIRQLFTGMRSDVQVEAEGEVVHLLPDDLDEKPHQLFLVELSNGITLKISHNIGVAPYVPLAKGDTIRFFGEYEYNKQGGVVHWTHRTQGTRNKHPHGWLLHKGKKYE